MEFESAALGLRVVQGRAEDKLGRPIASHKVTVARGDELLASGFTDRRGEYNLSFQGPGEALVSLSVPYPAWRLAETSIPPLVAGPTTVNWSLPTAKVSGRIGVGEDLVHQANGTMIEVVPAGEDPTVRVPGRSFQYLSGRGFEIPYLAQGTYTLVGWRRAPGERGWKNRHARSARATVPLTVEVHDIEPLKGVVLEPLPQLEEPER